MARRKIVGFRLGIYVSADAEVVDFAAPYGVSSAACRPRRRWPAYTPARGSSPGLTFAVTLLTAAKDLDLSQAAVLAGLLLRDTS